MFSPLAAFVSSPSKSIATCTLSMSLMAMSVTANAGFLDSISDIQHTINSIGSTADTIKGSKQAVTDLSQEVGFMEQAPEHRTGEMGLGAVLSGKLKSTKLFAQANKHATPVAVLAQQEIMIYMGTEQNGYYHVQSDKGEGWVLKPLVSMQDSGVR